MFSVSMSIDSILILGSVYSVLRLARNGLKAQMMAHNHPIGTRNLGPFLSSHLYQPRLLHNPIAISKASSRDSKLPSSSIASVASPGRRHMQYKLTTTPIESWGNDTTTSCSATSNYVIHRMERLLGKPGRFIHYSSPAGRPREALLHPPSLLSHLVPEGGTHVRTSCYLFICLALVCTFEDVRVTMDLPLTLYLLSIIRFFPNYIDMLYC
jgi:hypothetical protein